MPFVELSGHRIEYLVVRGTSRRYTYFRFRPDRRLEVAVPKGRDVDIIAAIQSRREWILRHFLDASSGPRILDRDAVMFDGQRLRIVFEKSYETEEFLPDRPRGEVIVRTSDRSRVLELVRRWFLRETSRYVVRKLAELSTLTPFEYKRADVRQMKNWGYCTKDGRLSFSWQLIALPERLREYVVFHEIAHLGVFNHSRAFKKRLAELCPDYRERERELDEILPGSLQEYL